MTETKPRGRVEPEPHWPIDDRLVAIEQRLAGLEQVVCELAAAIVGIGGQNIWARAPHTRKIYQWQQELERRESEATV
jgi:hypothetical protein